MSKSAFAAAFIFATTGLAFAGPGHDDLPAEVKARHGLMANYALNLGVLGDMAKGKTDYNAEVAAVAAANLAAFAKTDQSLLWPADTDTMSIEGTRALPKIWDDRADFDAKEADMAKAAEMVAGVAGTDLAALQGAMGGVGGACSACHKLYREPK
ncbi:cytochrome c556 [Litoreibacter halocynthiae]|uniref:Cytochrome c556 n=1 Tax=Litoreibacter halocynthiae TaxID=1242689 RepID=A0A4R7LPG4_9RHOB|nr:cytochrome c [Litoreibacter halocynthiae]TDT77654.1 cytochrome c556 [Litoreibacter halocynthiae]